MDGWDLTLIAIAPILGHAYSPFLGFHGGKALTTSFGIWTGLTLWEGPIVLGINLTFWSGFLASEGWVILFGVLGYIGFLLLSNNPVYILALGIANAGLLVWKYRSDLRDKPTLRTWLIKLIK